MSISRTVDICCDYCGVWFYGNGGSAYDTATDLRKSAKQIGWCLKPGRRRDQVDECTDCQNEKDGANDE